MKRKVIKQKKIFTNDISGNGLVFRVYKESQNSTVKKIQLENEQEIWRDISSKIIFWGQICMWKYVQHHLALGKYERSHMSNY